jgi:hypothetical protein
MISMLSIIYRVDSARSTCIIKKACFFYAIVRRKHAFFLCAYLNSSSKPLTKYNKHISLAA